MIGIFINRARPIYHRLIAKSPRFVHHFFPIVLINEKRQHLSWPAQSIPARSKHTAQKVSLYSIPKTSLKLVIVVYMQIMCQSKTRKSDVFLAFSRQNYGLLSSLHVVFLDMSRAMSRILTCDSHEWESPGSSTYCRQCFAQRPFFGQLHASSRPSQSTDRADSRAPAR